MALLGLLILFASAQSQSHTQSSTQAETAALKTISLDTVLMGSTFIFTAVHENKDAAWGAIEAGLNEVIRIEKLISSWDPNSQTSEISRQAGISPVETDPELIALIQRALKISELSDGYFDISFASAERYWKFDGSAVERPSDEEVAATVAKVGFEKIVIDPKKGTVYLSEKGMRIGFGAIGKGYAANKAGLLMQAKGCSSGVVNAGGDLVAWGKQANNDPWTVGIVNPVKNNQIAAQLDITDQAVVTSGNYLKFVMIDGLRYGHIINPKTGWPARGLTSVTVLCPDAELADALATTIFLLGKEEGMRLVNHLESIEALLITDEGELIYSKGIKIEQHEK